MKGKSPLEPWLKNARVEFPSRRDTVQQLRLPLERQVACPDCGGPLVVGEDAVTCPVCGFSREGSER